MAGKAVFKLTDLAYLICLATTIFSKVMSKLTTYIKESIEEMKKVTWPTKKETYHYTILIIGISLSVALFLGALDYGFQEGMKAILYKF